MKLSGFAASIAAALFAGALMLPAAANAADPPKPKPPTKEQFDKGAKDVPALIPAAGIQCTPDQMVWKGKGTDPKTKVESNAYEVSCKEGLGYVLITSSADPKPKAFDCLAAANSPQVCTLAGNADPKKGLAARAAAAGRQCDVTNATYVGTSASTGQTIYELACNGGAGFQLSLQGAKAEAIDCVMLIGSPRECKLTTAAQSMAALNPAIQKAAKPTCATKETRFIGSSPDGADTYFEVACQSGPGYVLDVDNKLAFKQAIDCTRAQGIGGGCKLTDVTTAETADAATYTKLANKAGYPCTVSKYRFIGTDKQNREVVELACTNRPDGAVAVFSETGKSDIYDCVRAGVLGLECKLTTNEPLYGKYSAALASKGKGQCKVSGARFVGASPTAEYVETACADGLPGWVLAFPLGGGAPSDVMTCLQASHAGAPCKLPSNLKANG